MRVSGNHREGRAVISGRGRLGSVGVAVGLALALVPAGFSPIAGGASRGASGGPGSLSHFGLAREDCLGTAPDTTSKGWFTVADGGLSGVYYPTAANTNVETPPLL